MASVYSMQIRSAIPGRVRWRVPVVIGRPLVAAAVAEDLETQAGVSSAVANPTTGGVLLLFRPDLALQEVQGWVEQAIARALAALDDLALSPRVAELADRGRALVRVRGRDRVALARVPAPASAARPGTSAASDAIERSPLLRLLDRTERHRDLIVLTTGTSIVNRLFEAAPPVMIGTAVDIVTRGPRSVLAWLGLKTIGAQLMALGGISLVVWTIDAAVGYLQTVLSARLANAVRHDLRIELYEHLQRLDIAQIESQGVSQWMALLDDDVAQVHRFIEEGTDPLVTIIANGVIVATTFTLLAPPLALAQVLLLPPLLFASTKLLAPIKERFKKARGDMRRLNALLHDNIAGMATIASFQSQDEEGARVAQASARHLESAGNAARMSAVYVPTLQMIVGGGFIMTLVWGGSLVSRGKLAAGAYNVMGFSELRLMVALGRMGVSLENYQRTNVALERILKVLDTAPRIASGTRPLTRTEATQELSLDRVVFGYTPDRPVLKRLSLRFPARRTTGIVGASGAGKSTVLKLLLRFYDAQDGAVRIGGMDVRDLRLEDLRAAIAMVPQEIVLFGGTVRENIAYGRQDATLDEVIAAAKLAEAHEFIEDLPDGYDTPLSHGAHTLSAGQRQRLAIARVILADRPIVLFDEATSALDHETEASVQRSLLDVTANRTTIIVAHRLSTIRHADVIYVLDDGELREQGRHDELIAADGIYASMWRVQTGEAAPRANGSAAAAPAPAGDASAAREPEPGAPSATPRAGAGAPMEVAAPRSIADAEAEAAPESPSAATALPALPPETPVPAARTSTSKRPGPPRRASTREPSPSASAEPVAKRGAPAPPERELPSPAAGTAAPEPTPLAASKPELTEKPAPKSKSRRGGRAPSPAATPAAGAAPTTTPEPNAGAKPPVAPGPEAGAKPAVAPEPPAAAKPKAAQGSAPARPKSTSPSGPAPKRASKPTPKPKPRSKPTPRSKPKPPK